MRRKSMSKRRRKVYDEMDKLLAERRKSPNPRTFEEHANRWLEDEILNLKLLIGLAEENTESPIEAIAYLHLLKWEPVVSDYTNPLITPQKEIGKYRVDFLIEYRGKKVIVECDGHDFHEKTKQQAARDKQRDRELTLLGYTVLRFTGSEIVADPRKVIQHIDGAIDGDYGKMLNGQMPDWWNKDGESSDDSHEN